jgi:GT2 family glycosyltransferase
LGHLDYKVTVAILNWNGLGHLKTFLPSVVSFSKEARILVIDNASRDGSVDWIKSTFPEVELVIFTENHGFTGGYNLGLKYVKTPYAVLLNSDVEVSHGWLLPLLFRMESDPEVAACQPKILAYKAKNRFEYAGASGGFLDVMGYPFCRGRFFDYCEKDKGQYNQSSKVFWATGACMMVRVKDYFEVGGLETQFFAHMEEIDLCWRFHHRGKSVWAEPGSVVYHLGGGTLSAISPKKTFLNFRNGLCLLYINDLEHDIYWKLPVRLILDGIAGLRFLFQGDVQNCFAIIKAHFSFYGNIRYWYQKRQTNRQLKTTEVQEGIVYRGSIVLQYFVLRIKEFRKLKF